jgi:hypothetical protein
MHKEKTQKIFGQQFSFRVLDFLWSARTAEDGYFLWFTVIAVRAEHAAHAGHRTSCRGHVNKHAMPR